MIARPDRCPSCGTERNAPPVEPYKSEESAGQITAWYRCPKCRCKWLVSWRVSALGKAA